MSFLAFAVCVWLAATGAAHARPVPFEPDGRQRILQSRCVGSVERGAPILCWGRKP